MIKKTYTKLFDQEMKKTVKKLTLVDLMALATIKPELFTKEHLDIILNSKKRIIDSLFNKFMKKEES